VIIENVEGLYNSNSGRDFGIIMQKMQSMGYAVAWRLFNSRYFGVPQSRPRVYLCCWKNNPMKALASLFEPEGAYKPHKERIGFLTESNGKNGYPKVPQIAYCLAATSGRHTGTDWSRTYVVCENGVRRMTPMEYERLQGFPDMWTLPPTCTSDDDTDTLRYTVLGNAVSVPVVEWIAKRVHIQLGKETQGFTSDSLHAYVPEFRKCKWIYENISEVDFTNSDESHIWPKAGLLWNGSYIGASVPPTPSIPINTTVYEIVEKIDVGSRYFLTPNAAEGILRRVDGQGRKLFEPLRIALEKEKNSKLTEVE
jgi:DNA (cytosine-5)-methyltransferase 1